MTLKLYSLLTALMFLAVPLAAQGQGGPECTLTAVAPTGSPAFPSTGSDPVPVVFTVTVSSGDPISITGITTVDGYFQVGFTEVDVGRITALAAKVTIGGHDWTTSTNAFPCQADLPSLQFQNTVPTAGGVTFLPLEPGAGQAITASLKNTADADGDTVTGVFAWNKDGSDTYNGATLPGNLANKGDVWTVTARPTDGYATGTPVYASVTILAADTDGDGIRDDVDNCVSQANADQKNSDDDPAGDTCDSDDDNDGYSDLVESNAGSDPRNAASIPSDTDGDTIANDKDNCPTDANPFQNDLDSDGIGDVCDDDRDGDGYLNEVDEVPDDKRYHLDADKDGVADELDACPGFNDKLDLDLDGIPDGCDIDDDGDGVPDGHDRFPRDKTESKDDDRDGIGNNGDNCPDHVNPLQEDGDGDKIGDACDDEPDTPPQVDLTTPPVLQRPDRLTLALSGGRARLFFSLPSEPTSSHYLVWRYSTPELIGTVAVEPGKTDYFFDAGLVPDGTHNYGVIGIDAIEKRDAAVALLTGMDTVALTPGVTRDGYVDCPADAFDQDRDGLCDAVEVKMGLDPLNADSDGDGRLDGEELMDLDGQGFGNPQAAPGPDTGTTAALGGGVPLWIWSVLVGVPLAAGAVAVGVLAWLRRKDTTDTTDATGLADPADPAGATPGRR